MWGHFFAISLVENPVIQTVITFRDSCWSSVKKGLVYSFTNTQFVIKKIIVYIQIPIVI